MAGFVCVCCLLELTHDMIALLFEIADFICFTQCTFQTYLYVNYANTVVYFCMEVKLINTARPEVVITVAKNASLLGLGTSMLGLVPDILKDHDIFIVRFKQSKNCCAMCVSSTLVNILYRCLTLKMRVL